MSKKTSVSQILNDAGYFDTPTVGDVMREHCVEMRDCIERTKTDPEICGIEVDEIIARFLRSIGMGELVDEWKKAKRWYA